MPLELPEAVYQGEDKRWYKPCSECGELQSYLRRNYAIHSYLEGKACKKCSNRKTENCHRGFLGEIRTSWWSKTRHHAGYRKLSWNITPEYIESIWKEQGKRCALSGYPVCWGKEKNLTTTGITASIDRIDSNYGYVEGNVQVVHKHVNMMKQSFDNDYFIEMCLAIAEENS